MDELQTCASVQVGNLSPDEQEKPIRKVANIYSDRRDCIAIKNKLMKLVNKEEYTKTLIAYLHGSCSKQFFDEKMSSILTTPAAKLTHNELIRSILFNAHFTMTPPPNLDAPLPQVPQHIKDGSNAVSSMNSSFIPNTPNPISNYLNDNLNLESNENTTNFTYYKYKKSQMNPLKDAKTFTAFNMRHLPSIYQLSSRVENLVSERNINSVDINAVKILYHELKATIVSLLKSCVIFHQQNKSKDDVYDNDDADFNSTQLNTDESDSLISVSDALNAIEENRDIYSIVSFPVLTKYFSHVNK